MGVLCRDSDPPQDPPKAQLCRRENIDLDEMKMIRFQNNGSVINAERELTIGINRRDSGCSDPLFLLPRSHPDLISKQAQVRRRSKQGLEGLECGGRKTELGFAHWETVDKDVYAHAKWGAS
jgi:hypothetical protein